MDSFPIQVVTLANDLIQVVKLANDLIRLHNVHSCSSFIVLVELMCMMAHDYAAVPDCDRAVSDRDTQDDGVTEGYTMHRVGMQLILLVRKNFLLQVLHWRYIWSELGPLWCSGHSSIHSTTPTSFSGQTACWGYNRDPDPHTLYGTAGGTVQKYQ